MNFLKALDEVKKGNKITRPEFEDGVYIQSKSDAQSIETYIADQDYDSPILSIEDFLATDWRIYCD